MPDPSARGAHGAAHACAWCRNDQGDAVAFEAPSIRCVYLPRGKGRCRMTAAYVVEGVYCPTEHCVNDPEHSEACSEDPWTVRVCSEHGLVMRTDRTRWQSFRSIRTLETAVSA